MNTSFSLQAIADKAAKSGRIGFADVQRLTRVVLADGITSRADAERMIGLDRDLRRRDPAWAGVLVATLVDFVVWAERPTGTVSEDTARWLAAALDGAAPRTARLIAREIAEEAQAFENDALAALAAIGSRPTVRRLRGAEVVIQPAPAGTEPHQAAA